MVIIIENINLTENVAGANTSIWLI